jgi:branched-subunit amino acid aminotransferase/4-amino-4-deoxychorismate lyase
MTEPLAFLNGALIPQSEASLALNDAGFVYGATVTDLCRTFRHRLFLWPEHLARFRESCRFADIGVQFTDEHISDHAHQLVAANSKLIPAEHDLALVMFATPGPIGYYLGQSFEAGDSPTFGMHTFALPFERYRRWIEQGAHLITPDVRQIPPACIPPHMKHRSRMHYWLAEMGVRGRGAHALLLDEQNHVTETPTSNLLVVKNGTVLSPRMERILPGVSLDFVKQLCCKLGIAVKHRDITLGDCYDADEMFLTNTACCLASVVQINDRVIPLGGPVFQRLLDAWNAEVGIDIHGQIRGQR